MHPNSHGASSSDALCVYVCSGNTKVSLTTVGKAGKADVAPTYRRGSQDPSNQRQTGALNDDFQEGVLSSQRQSDSFARVFILYVVFPPPVIPLPFVA